MQMTHFLLFMSAISGKYLIEFVLFRWLIEFVVSRCLVELVIFRCEYSLSSWHLDILRISNIKCNAFYDID